MSTWAGSQANAIDVRVRDAAMQAVKKHNLPLGEWLARALDEAPPGTDLFAQDPSQEDAPERDRLRRLADALERLAAKVDGAEQRSAVALFGMDRTLSDLSGRLAGAEAGMRDETLRLLAVLGEVKELQAQVFERVALLEEEPAAQRALEALRTIEARLDHMTAHLHAQETRALRDADQLREDLAETQDRLAARLDEAEEQARSTDAAWRAGIEDVDARLDAALADIRRTVGAIETGAAEIMAQQRRLSDTVSGVATATVEIYGAQQRLEAELKALDARQNDLEARAEHALSAKAALEEAAGRVEAAARDGLVALDDRFGAERSAIEERLATVQSLAQRAADELEARLLEAASAREARLDERLSALGARLGEALAVVDTRAERIGARIAAAEERGAQIQQSLRAELLALEERLGLSRDAGDQRLNALRERLEAQIGEVREQAAAQLAAALADARPTPGGPSGDGVTPEEFDESIGALNARLAAAEHRHAQTVEAVSEELRRLTEAIDSRLRAVESKAESALAPPPYDLDARLAEEREALDARLSSLREQLQSGLATAAADTDARLGDALAQIGARLDEITRPAPAPIERAAEAEPPLAAPEAAVPLAEAPLDLLEPHGPEAEEEPPLTFEAAASPLASEPVIGDPGNGDVAAAASPLSTAETEPAAQENDPWRDADSAALDDLLAPEPLPAPPPEPAPVRRASTKDDYLGAARRAALAQAEATSGRKARVGGALVEKAPAFKLTPGLVRIGAAAIVVCGVAGAYFALRGPTPAPEPAPVTSGEPSSPQTISVGDSTRAGPVTSLEEAARAGDPLAQYDLGVRLLGSGATVDGVRQIEQAAAQGLAMAQYRLAKLFERGEGVEQNLAEARRWTELAAQGGNVKAMHDLGVYNARGEGAPQDEAAAFRWFREAASYGVMDSQFNLGVLYDQGRGAPQDAAEALFWFFVAASGGDADAAARANALEQRLAPDVSARVRARADAFTAKPINPRANGNFGVTPWSQAEAAPPSPQAPGGELR